VGAIVIGPDALLIIFSVVIFGIVVGSITLAVVSVVKGRRIRDRDDAR
jgi:hypothetical protein